MRIIGYVAVAIFVLIAFWVYMEYFYIPADTVTIKSRKNYDIVMLRLPNDPNPEVFGAPFWEARHTLAELTPCPTCRLDAVTHEEFFHDWVNKKLKKKMEYPENYVEWINRLCNEKKSC